MKHQITVLFRNAMLIGISMLFGFTVQNAMSAQEAARLYLTAGKSTLLPLPFEASRLSVGNPEVVDVILISPKEVYLLGKKIGTTNVMIWSKAGATKVIDLNVALDVQELREHLLRLVPSEKNLKVDVLAETVVLSGTGSDPIKLQRLINLSEVFTGVKKVINLMRLQGSQQVMLEVKVAEVSKSLMDELGFGVNGSRTNGAASFGVVSAFLGSGAGTASAANGSTSIRLDAEIKKGLVKILAEPTITAISGQEGSFLAGGKIFIPVPQASTTGTSSIALEEREFGVGLKFTPTVLEDGLINLRVTPEVSELSQVGTSVTASNGQTSILPSITTRRASTTVQLRDGESFAIGGLIKSNLTESVKAFPVLGELPIIGMLFRSSAFQSERTELVFVVTPHLAKSSVTRADLPTDSFVEPTRLELMLKGQLEGVFKEEPVIQSSPSLMKQP